MQKSNRLDILIVSFALFSMFFGAGNVIFPPYLGTISGNKFFVAGLGFVLTGAGLPILGIIAMSNAGTLEAFSKNVFKGFPLILGVCVMIAIGPLLAIPKTAALTNEIGVHTLFPSANPKISIAIFFIITFIFCINESNVIDKLGAILTPLLLISLIILIVKGIISPIGTPKLMESENSFGNGFVEGYQTMDALASIMFAGLILKNIKYRGYTGKELKKITSITGIIAGIGLAIIYLGMIYIGACANTLITGQMTMSEIVVYISQSVLGNYGKIIIASIIGLACLTTAVGLTTTAGLYFQEITKGRLKYKFVVLFTCIFSCMVAYKGVDKIVAFSAPILSALYPTVIILIIFNVFKVKTKSLYTGCCLLTLIYSILVAFLPKKAVESVIGIYPLFGNPFGWIPIAIIGGFVFYFLFKEVKFD